MAYMNDYLDGFKDTLLYGHSTFWVKTKVDELKYKQYGTVYKLTIHYKKGNTYHVKNARDIKVWEHKSGGYDIEYVYNTTENLMTEYGEKKINSVVEVKTDTHDVVAITTETRKDSGNYHKNYVEFGK